MLGMCGKFASALVGPAKGQVCVAVLARRPPYCARPTLQDFQNSYVYYKNFNHIIYPEKIHIHLDERKVKEEIWKIPAVLAFFVQ